MEPKSSLPHSQQPVSNVGQINPEEEERKNEGIEKGSYAINTNEAEY